MDQFYIVGDSEAFKCYILAANQGDANAQYNLGMMYFNGRGVEQSDSKAFKYFKLSAEQGNAYAQYNLGTMYYDGRGVEQSDSKAFKYLKLLAEQGDAYAQYFLGTMYCDGRGVEQSDSKAFKYFMLSAEQGNANSQCSLGIMYDDGSGVEQSDSKAFKYFMLSAEQGNAYAQYFLGAMYYDGRGVEQSDSKAFKYLKLSAEQGHDNAISSLENLRKHKKIFETNELLDIEIKENLYWVNYSNKVKYEIVETSKIGKWMYFFSDKNFVAEICKKAINENVTYSCKHSNSEKGVACFYVNYDDDKYHRKIIRFLLDNNLIKRTKSGKLTNIAFKLDEQTQKGEYGSEFKAKINLESFIDLTTGEFK